MDSRRGGTLPPGSLVTLGSRETRLIEIKQIEIKQEDKVDWSR